jgi:hypothetical protein
LKLIQNLDALLDANQACLSLDRHAASANANKCINKRLNQLAEELISLNRPSMLYFIVNARMKADRTIMAIILASVMMMIAGHALFADERPLLLEAHRAAGLNCAQCHQEQPPKLAPSTTTCLRCHGDQQALAEKTREAFPNPHASLHLAAGETQICSDCHHVHRPSEVSCSACHREFYFNVK